MTSPKTDEQMAKIYFELKMKHMSPDEIKYYKENPDKSFTMLAYLDGRASMRDEFKVLVEAVKRLSLNKIHKVEYYDCDNDAVCYQDCPACLTIESIKPFAKKDAT